MININFVTKYEKWPFFRQTPSAQGRWENCTFSINAQSNTSFDWIIVYGDPPVNFQTKLAKERRILFIVEPPSIKTYSKKYLSQFGIIVTPFFLKNCPDECRQHVMQSGLPWHYGISRADITKHRNYDDFMAEEAACEKKMFCSSVISNKQITHEQRVRSRTLLKLQEEFPEFKLFGNGYCSVDNKEDAIAPYKFHIVAENNSLEHFWTEKLADAYLGWSVPLFCGGKNLSNYFPVNSFIPIDLSDYEKTKKLLLDLKENADAVYKEKIQEVSKARNLILNDYNVFNLISSIVEQNTETVVDNKVGFYTIQSDAKYTDLKKIFRKIKNCLKLDSFFGLSR